jgi:hypothetical protein
VNRESPPLLGDPLALDDGVRGEGGGAEVADLADARQVGKGAEGFLEAGVPVWAVDLVQVDVVGAEATEAVVEGLGEVAPGRTARQRVVVQRVAGLGGEDDVVAALAEGLAEEGLGLAKAVAVGGVEEADAGVEGLADELVGAGLVDVAPCAEVHRAEAEDAGLHAVVPSVRCSTSGPFGGFGEAASRTSSRPLTPCPCWGELASSTARRVVCTDSATTLQA